MRMMRLKKWKNNPILEPTGEGDWEKLAVCNPGAWYEDGKVFLLYRASAETEIYRIYIGLAVSEDGFHFKRVSDRPIYTPTLDYEAGCAEDPRIVKFDDTFYVTYACRAHSYTEFVQGKIPAYPSTAPRALRENLTRTALLSSKDLKTFKPLGPITGDDVDDRDVIIFPEKVNGKYVMIHRPAEWIGKEYGVEKPSIWMAFSDDLLHWHDETLLAQPEFNWQSQKVGGSTPPLKTEYGWLLMYHGVDEKRIYRQGLMMLDLNDPTKIIARPPDFILEPTEDFEINGVEHDVVFAVGNVVIEDDLYVYYGGADKVCCVATANFNDIIGYTMSHLVKKKATIVT